MTPPRPAPDCCTEFAGLSRRGLIRGAVGAGLAATVFGTGPGSTFVQTAYATTRSAPRVVVLLSLRGAADGLSLVVPHGDPVYYAARPSIAVPKASLLAADGFFGLHPALAPLLGLWNAGRLAAVHATGLPAPNRSHFAAMEELEDADPGSTARVGWINRLIGTDTDANPLQAIGLHMSAPIAALAGPQATVTAGQLDQVSLAGGDPDGRRHRAIHTLWAHRPGGTARSARRALRTIDDFAHVLATPAGPANGARYPEDGLGQALAAAARTIRGDVGAEVIAVDHDGGWDMHTDLGTPAGGRMREVTASFATSLAAFFTDLGALSEKVTVVAVSEFGRRVQENASYGVDHGYGNVMLLAGAGVRGGYYGHWPGLQNTLDADLQVTTDYRSVLAEVVTRRLGASSAVVFPGFTPEPVGALTSG